MDTQNSGHKFLEEFKNFLTFLQSLWGILAGITTLFPLSNVLTQAIPLQKFDKGSLFYLEPSLVTVIATLACLFVLVWTFGNRYKYAEWTRHRMYQRAWLSFGSGFVVLIGYIALNAAATDNLYSQAFGWGTGDLQNLFGDIVLLLLYTAFFVMLTRAFVLLALVEYLDIRKS